MKPIAVPSSRSASRMSDCVLAIVSLVLWACSAAHAQTSPVVDYEYDAQGNLTKATDALGRVTSMNYDALNRLRQTIQPSPTSGEPTPRSSTPPTTRPGK